MRFPKDSRAAVYAASPNAATVPWPSSEEDQQPELGRVYWMLGEAKPPLPVPPETCADVMADMRGKPRPKRRRRAGTRRNAPRSGDPRVRVDAIEVQPDGVEVSVKLVTDPVISVRTKARVEAHVNPLSTLAGDPVTGKGVAETEPEQIPLRRSRKERLEDEEAVRLEHQASIDESVALRAEAVVARQHRKGRPGTIAQIAARKARRRAEAAASEREED